MADELTAANVMTEGVIAIEKDASVQEAATLMADEDIRSLVVLDDEEAVGIVVGRDIVYNVVRSGLDAAGTRVGDVMTSDIVTATPSDDVSDIARAMLQHNISRVPILSGDQLVGIVTQSNIIEAWPAYIDLLQEESQLLPLDSSEADVEETEGECEQCENYSDELVAVNRLFLCPSCRAEL